MFAVFASCLFNKLCIYRKILAKGRYTDPVWDMWTEGGAGSEGGADVNLKGLVCSDFNLTVSCLPLNDQDRILHASSVIAMDEFPLRVH